MARTQVVPQTYSAAGGFFSAKARHLAPPDVMTSESVDWMFSPVEAKAFRRPGTAEIDVAGTGAPPFDGLLSGNYQNGINVVTGLDGAATKTRRKGRGRINELNTNDKPYGNDPLFAHLVTDESLGFSYDSSPYGTLFFATDLAYTTPYAGPIPMASVASTTRTGEYPNQYNLSSYTYFSYPFAYLGGGRFVSNKDKWKLAAGGRNYLTVNNWIALSKLDGIPAKWNARWKDYGTSVERALPVGHIPPMWPVSISATHTNDGSWPDDATFYYVVMFEWEDGSYSPHTQIRPSSAGTILANSGGSAFQKTAIGGLCVYNLTNSTTGSVGPYGSITVSNIPIGPRGVRRRLLLRSLVVTGANAVPDPATIGLCATIDDNTTTEYVDYYGMDAAVEPLPESVRNDYMWPPGHRYLWSFDQRIACGYTKPNRAAILISGFEANNGLLVSPYKITTTSEEECFMQRADRSSGSRNYSFFIKKQLSELHFVVWNGYSLESDGSKTLWYDVLNLTNLTLQDVVDHINLRSKSINVTGAGATGWGSSNSPWDPKTSLDSPAEPYNSPWANYVGFWAQLAPGADGTALATEIEDTTYYDFGDKFTWRKNGGSNQREMDFQRVYGSSWPGILVMGSTWADRYPAQKKTMYFTAGGPGVPPNALNSWFVGNFRSAMDETGSIVGGAPLLDGCLVFGTTGISIMRNLNNGKSGVDDDYRLETISGSSGCISPDSIASVNGAVVYLSREGLIATDGREFVNISRAIYDPGTKTGVWNYEINLCTIAMQQDDDDYGFGCTAIEGKLWVWYRTDATTRRVMVYDYSSSPAKSGVAQFMDASGKPFPWSCPLTIDVTTIGSYVTESGGTNILGLVEGKDGEFRVLGVGTEDPGNAAIQPVGYLATDYLGTGKKKSTRRLVIRYKKTSTGMSIGVTKNLSAHLNPGYYSTYALPATVSGDPFKRKYIELPQIARGLGDVVEIKVTDSGAGAEAEFWEIGAEIELVDSFY
jgi:hypothetical protein